MARMLGKSGKIPFRTNCTCCNLSEHNLDKSGGKRIKRARENKSWRKDQNDS